MLACSLWGFQIIKEVIPVNTRYPQKSRTIQLSALRNLLFVSYGMETANRNREKTVKEKQISTSRSMSSARVVLPVYARWIATAAKRAVNEEAVPTVVKMLFSLSERESR